MATSGVWALQRIYNKQVSSDWVTSAYVPPPPEVQFGWFGGGSPGPVSVVDRIDYNNDTNTAIIRGPLSSTKSGMAAAGNDSYGWFGGANGVPARSTVDRIDYASDAAAASTRGPLSAGRYRLAASGNNIFGWWTGGLSPAAPSFRSTVDRITYMSDTNTASLRGNLTWDRYFHAGVGNNFYSWFVGGLVNNPSKTAVDSSVDRIEYATDTSTASLRGPLTTDRYILAATGNSNFGWVGGGFPGTVSTVNKITYATDSNVATTRGPLNLGRYGLSATGSSDYGWFGGGLPGAVSVVDRIDYAADTNTAAIRGSISSAREYLAATGGFPG